MSGASSFAIDDLLRINQYRRGHIVFCLGIFLVVSALTCFITWFGFVRYAESSGLLLFVVAAPLSLAIGGWLLWVFDKDYRRKIKKTFMKNIASKFGLTYNAVGAFRIGDIYDHRIIPTYDRVDIEDGFSGRIKSRKFQIQETRFKKITKDAENRITSETTFFTGLIIKIDLQKFLDYETIVLPRTTPPNALHLYKTRKLEGAETVGLPSKFEKKYKVYSTHQIESRVILDPAFMERFLDLCDHLKSKALWASFQKDQLLIIASYNKDLFEAANIFKPVMHDDLLAVMEELKAVQAITEHLNFNPHTGL